MMKLRVYEHGKAREIPHDSFHKGIVLEVETPDGQTVQLYVRQSDNASAVEVEVRGWGNKPRTVGNMDQLTMCGLLLYQDPKYDEHGNSLRENEALEEIP